MAILDILFCRHCKSKNIKPFKTIGFGSKIGKVYHVGMQCLDCKSKYHLPRSQDMFALTKDIPWEYSKSFKREIQK